MKSNQHNYQIMLMNRMMKRVMWTLSALLLCLCATSCKTKVCEECEPDGKYKVDAEILVVRKDGTIVSTTKLRGDTSSIRANASSVVETTKGKITGLGYFDANAVTTISVSANKGYAYKGMYFRYNSGYNATAYPTSSRSALKSSTKSVTVTGNLTVIALFEVDDSMDIIIE